MKLSIADIVSIHTGIAALGKLSVNDTATSWNLLKIGDETEKVVDRFEKLKFSTAKEITGGKLQEISQAETPTEWAAFVERITPISEEIVDLDITPVSHQILVKAGADQATLRALRKILVP